MVTKVNETPVLEAEEDFPLTTTKAQHLVDGLTSRIDAILAAIKHHQHEVQHPSMMNPQVEYHQQQADLLIMSLAEVINLRVELANAFSIEISPVQIETQVQPDFFSPAEHNRPASAKPGPGNAGSSSPA